MPERTWTSTKLRGWHITQMQDNLKTVESILNMSDPEELTIYRDGGTGWTVLETLCHLRDTEDVFAERLRLTLEQDEPPLPFPNPDEVARERRYNEQVTHTVLAQWKGRRAALNVHWQACSGADWERVGIHPTRGRLTLLEQFLLLPIHDSLHLEQMTRTLSERRLSL